ncbi:hypothetical protein B0A55_10515, partial [Friedmanniomyces simplex]
MPKCMGQTQKQKRTRKPPVSLLARQTIPARLFHSAAPRASALAWPTAASSSSSSSTFPTSAAAAATTPAIPAALAPPPLRPAPAP